MIWSQKSIMFSADDYRREAKKNLDKEKAKETRKNKPHWEVRHRYTSKHSNLIHCPRLCQQKENGSKGKKTFDPKRNVCISCGYKKDQSQKNG